MIPRGLRLLRLVVLAVVVVGLVSLVPLVAEACPTCKDGLAHGDPRSAALTRGYFWSILFMMSMPFLILAGLGSYFYYEICKARRLAASSGERLPSAERLATAR